MRNACPMMIEDHLRGYQKEMEQLCDEKTKTSEPVLKIPIKIAILIGI